MLFQVKGETNKNGLFQLCCLVTFCITAGLEFFCGQAPLGMEHLRGSHVTGKAGTRAMISQAARPEPWTPDQDTWRKDTEAKN